MSPAGRRLPPAPDIVCHTTSLEPDGNRAERKCSPRFTAGVDQIKKSPAFLPGLNSGYISECLNPVIGTEAILKVLIAQAINLLTEQFSVVVIVDT